MSDDFYDDEDDFQTLVIDKSENDRPDIGGEFFEDVQKLVRQYIDLWFADKEMSCGGPIPPKMLYRAQYITQVLNTDISVAIERAYEAVSRCKFFYPQFHKETAEGLTGVEEDVFAVLDFLSKSAMKGIPKVFQGGLLLMHLELCCGVDV